MLAFRSSGEGEECANGTVLIEVIDVLKSGQVELAFNVPLPGRPRIYLKVSLPEIIESMMQQHGKEG